MTRAAKKMRIIVYVKEKGGKREKRERERNSRSFRNEIKVLKSNNI